MRISDWSSDVCSSDLPPTPMTTPLLEQLIEAFRVLPGVGQKTAQRMAYHVLERDRDGGRRLADPLAESIERIGHCARCPDFSETATRAPSAPPPLPPQHLFAVQSPTQPLVYHTAPGHPAPYPSAARRYWK